MKREVLEEKKNSIERHFEAQQERKRQLQSEIALIDEELLKLSGEYRLITDFIENYKQNKESKKNG